MNISEVMTKSPSCSQPEMGIEEIAHQMLVCNCGCLPVMEGGRVVGIITDRDIVVRAVAAGKATLGLQAKDVMSHPVAVVSPDEDIVQALKTMEENKVRRAPVVDGSNRLVGMVSLSDLARASSSAQIGAFVQSISETLDIGHE